MSDPYLGEIRMFGSDFAPTNWHLCDGALLQISAYSALYSLIGTTYGGDGISNFALPDLRGRLPICRGQGVGLTLRAIGQKAGSETVAVTNDQLPNHNHAAYASTETATQSNPQGNVCASPVNTSGTAINQFVTYSSTYKIGLMDPAAIGSTGSGAAHDNVMPSMPLNFIICCQGGLYPSRS